MFNLTNCTCKESRFSLLCITFSFGHTNFPANPVHSIIWNFVVSLRLLTHPEKIVYIEWRALEQKCLLNSHFGFWSRYLFIFVVIQGTHLILNVNFSKTTHFGLFIWEHRWVGNWHKLPVKLILILTTKNYLKSNLCVWLFCNLFYFNEVNCILIGFLLRLLFCWVFYPHFYSWQHMRMCCSDDLKSIAKVRNDLCKYARIFLLSIFLKYALV